ncbi:MAG: hypothetical protein ABIR91_04690, partial [Candidatus Saccharimonadales bacterium]
MATDQLDRSKQEHLDDDERNNPSGVSRDLYRQENDAIDGYDRNKDGLDDHPVSGGDASGKSGDLNDRENNTMNYRPSNYGGKKSERGRPWSKANVKAVLKNKKVIGLIVGVGAIGGVGLGSLLMGALAPIAFLENVTKDLDTQVAAIDVRGTSIFRNKIPKDANKVLTGCTTLSIRCKMKTISTEQKNRLAAKGIDVVDEKKAKVGGKWRSQPTKYKFQNVEYDARAFATEIRKPGSPLRTAYTRANNMKFLGMADASFKRVMNRFGISKKPPELKGSKKDKINTLMNKTGSTDTKDISFTKYTDENGKDYYELDGDNTDPKTRYRGDQKDTMEKALAGAKTSAPPSRAKTNTIKGLSVLGAADLACTVKNMIGLATVAAKVANQVELAQYAMRVASTVQKVQSGYGDVDDGEVIGEFFGATDSRRQIVDVDKAIESKGSGKSATVGPVDGDVPMKNNPNYGKSAMDSPLYQLS